jgi:hypothetical protein
MAGSGILGNNDPRSELMMQFLQLQNNQQPMRRGEGLGRGLQSLAQGLMLGRLADRLEKKQKAAAGERSDAISFALGKPAETEKFADGTAINWNERNPDYAAAAGMLQSPENEGLLGSLFDAKVKENIADKSMKKEFEKLMIAQALQDKSAMTLEDYKNPENALKRQVFGGLLNGGNGAPSVPQQAPVAPMPLSETPTNAPVPAPPSPDQLSGISVDGLPQDVPATPMPQDNATNPVVSAMLEKVFGKPPEGKVWTQDGKLADNPSTQKGKEGFENLINRMVKQYSILDENSGIPNADKSVVENLWRKSASDDQPLVSVFGVSPLPSGQELGKRFGTKNQRARETIKNLKGNLVPFLSAATGISAQLINSNVELQNVLRSIGDEKSDVGAAYEALALASQKYGTGKSADEIKVLLENSAKPADEKTKRAKELLEKAGVQ